MEDLKLSLIFENILRRFSDDQNEQSSLAFSARRFIQTSQIYREVTPNDEHDFVVKYFLLLDDGEDICYLL